MPYWARGRARGRGFKLITKKYYYTVKIVISPKNIFQPLLSDMRPGGVPRILTVSFHNYTKKLYKLFLGAKVFSKSFTADHNTFTCLFSLSCF